MKTNLKSYPDSKNSNYYWQSLGWKERFEQELRERLDADLRAVGGERNEAYLGRVHGIIDLIQEILGEDSPIEATKSTEEQ